MVTSRIWFTAAQKAELWERWKQGQSISSIGTGAGAKEQDGRPADRVLARRHCATSAASSGLGAETGGARGDFARDCGRSIAPVYCRDSWAIAIDAKPRDFPQWWCASLSRGAG